MKDTYDLPYDPETGDIVCRRCKDGSLQFNIPRTHIHHSPAGFEWGYGGSGPADFALNILAWLVDSSRLSGNEAQPVELWDRTTVPQMVWDWHQSVKFYIVAEIPYDGGTVTRQAIRELLEEQTNLPEGVI